MYADESNNTGENLQDVDQPVFTVAGVHLDDAHAKDIVESVAASMKKGAGEPKYSLLSRRPAGRDILMSAFAALPADSVKLYVADKRFMTVTKIIDLGIEPLMFADGYNMWADGSARSLAHTVALVGPVLGDEQKFDAVLQAFVLALRSGSTGDEDYVVAVEEYLATLTQSDESIFRSALLPVQNWLTHVLAERSTGLHPDTLDPAIPTIVAVCRAFCDILGSIRLVHDESKVIGRNKNLLIGMDQLPDPAHPDRLMSPIGVKSVDFGDSKEVDQLKIADWVAGAARDVAMSRLGFPRDMAGRELCDLVESWLAAPPLWLDADWLADHLGIRSEP